MKIDPEIHDLRTIADEFKEGFASISFSQLGEDLHIMRFFAKVINGFYLDVGCFHPRRYSNTYLLRKYMGWRGAHIDANPEIIARFSKELPDHINIHAAVDDQEGVVDLTIYKGAAHSTIDARRKQFNEKFDVRSNLTLCSVSLETLVDQYVPPNQKIDFVNIDVEGRDLQAIRSFNLNRFRPSLVCIEDHEFVAAINGGRRSEIFNHMVDHNYYFASHHVASTLYTAKAHKD